jgi:hypothetical protein
MTTPRHQEIYRWVGYIFTGLIALGSVLSAINNSRSLISWPVTLIGSAAILLFWIYLNIHLKRKPFEWKAGNGRLIKISKLKLKNHLFIVGIILLLWIPRLISMFEVNPQQPRITVSPAKPNEVLILITDFKNDSRNRNYDIAGSIELAINEGLSQNCTESYFSTVRIERINRSYYRNQLEEVRSMAERYNAAIVIWGYYDDAGVFP